MKFLAALATAFIAAVYYTCAITVFVAGWLVLLIICLLQRPGQDEPRQWLEDYQPSDDEQPR